MPHDVASLLDMLKGGNGQLELKGPPSPPVKLLPGPYMLLLKGGIPPGTAHGRPFMLPLKIGHPPVPFQGGLV
jgi:hypothetical protein